MPSTNDQRIKVAILDLYYGTANQGIRGFESILNQYKAEKNIDLTYEVFDVRAKEQLPGSEFDIYLSSGGPGSPMSQDEVWDKKYFQLIDNLQDHNLSNKPQKKYGFFVCHSFQLLCRQYKLGDVSMRRSESYGVFPVHLTKPGRADQIYNGLPDPFYAIDSRYWQVINPDEKRFMDMGMQLLAIEKERPHIDLPRAMMAIKLSEYFTATQFHPEVSPEVVKTVLLREDKKKQVVEENGLDKYNQFLEGLDDPGMIALTYNTLIPNFLDNAIRSLQESA